MARLYVVGIGPGGRQDMTFKAYETIKKCSVIVGYSGYIKYVKDLISDKEVISTPMRGEIERCSIAVEKVKGGFDTAIISTGDAGLYGMAGPILELGEGISVEIVPGVTAAFSAASYLGAPIMNDFCTISLSDILTPWEVIEKRLECAAIGDFIIAIYNPKSKNRINQMKKAIYIISKYKDENTPCGIVKNAGREGFEKTITTIKNMDCNKIDMMSTVIIGNSNTYVKGGRMITPRGYSI